MRPSQAYLRNVIRPRSRHFCIIHTKRFPRCSVLVQDGTGKECTQLVAGDHANQEATVTATVTAVKERELPEADDEFAQLASEFDTLDELTGDLRKRIGEAKRVQQATQAREKMLEKLIEITEVPLPESIVDAEVEVRQHDLEEFRKTIR